MRLEPGALIEFPIHRTYIIYGSSLSACPNNLITKQQPMPTKLPRPSYKSYVNNISLFEACFSKLKFQLSKFIGRFSLSAHPNNLITK